jgi:predicted RNase H-like HicB family nuclease
MGAAAAEWYDSIYLAGSPMVMGGNKLMKFQVVIYPAEEGGFWAEAPGFPGCVSCGDTLEETRVNIRDAFEGVFEVMQETAEPDPEFQTQDDRMETLDL